ncbi:zinc finger protein 830-like [Oppia nitens]|uniref:zinc finger protein 830-like n=1 Tax=Oppia nitens TaxID=1686743 RepID=UPI0023D99E7C|nr:zinc finger protein 830-like [Oppia nitens]
MSLSSSADIMSAKRNRSKDEDESNSSKRLKPDNSLNKSDDSFEKTNSIPKGFFDDPVMDAKARKVVFKDPIDEQWEQFQKVIAEETHVSQNIIEEDIEELQIDRNIEEIEEQIANWHKVNEMQKRAEQIHNHLIDNKDNIKREEVTDSDSDIDEQELNVFSNWRSRKALNHN